MLGRETGGRPIHVEPSRHANSLCQAVEAGQDARGGGNPNLMDPVMYVLYK